MKKWFKRFVISVVVLLIAAFIGVAVFILNIDPSAYKHQLASMIKKQYDRELLVEGDIELSLFPRIGLTVEKISLSESGSTEVFARIDKVRMAVALWPLISNRFLVDHLAIDGFTANIVRLDEGRYNYDDLIRSAISQTNSISHSGLETQGLTPSLSNTDFKVDIAGLTLTKGELTYSDKLKDSFAHLKEMNVRTGRITEGQPFDLSLSGHLLSESERIDTQVNINGLMLLKPLENTYSFDRLNVDLTGRWQHLNLDNANIKGELSINTLQNALTASQLELALKGSGTEESMLRDVQARLIAPRVSYSVGDLRLGMSNVRLDAVLNRKDKQTLQMNFDAPELDISPKQAAGEPVKGEISLKTAAQQLKLGVSLNKITGMASALNVAEVELTGLYQIANDKSLRLLLKSPSEIRIFQQSFEFPQLKGELILNEKGQAEQKIPLTGNALSLLNEQSIHFFLTAKLNPSTIDIKGQVQDLFHPKVNFDVRGDKLDLKAFVHDLKLPLSGLRLAGKEESTSPSTPLAVLSEQQNKEAQQEVKDPKEVKNLSLKQELLSRLSGIGTFNFAQVFYNGLKAENLGATLLFDHSDVQVRSVRAKAYDGELYANGAYALNQHELKGDISLTKIELSDLLKGLNMSEILSGETDIKILFQSHGDTEQALMKALQANVQLSTKQGKLKGFDLNGILQHPEEYVDPWDMNARLSAEADVSTDFSTLVFEGQLQREQFHIEKFSFTTPSLGISAKPSMADYHFGTKYLYLPAILKAKKGLKVKRSGVNIQVNNVELPILIQGYGMALDAKVQLDQLLESRAK